MSAKRRQETIARFSVPVREETTSVVPSSDGGRPTRKRKRTKVAIEHKDVDELNDAADSDLIQDEDKEDDDFVDDDGGASSKKKGKGKSKGKQRQMSPINDEFAFDGPNPKVMLISLKAGALGLNLTVANNVYL